MASPPQSPSVAHRVLDGIGCVSEGVWKLTTSAVIVSAIAIILWAGTMHLEWISTTLPYFGQTLPCIGPITLDLAQFMSTVAVLVLATLYINSKR